MERKSSLNRTIGIDLGTTNSVVSVLQGGRPQTIMVDGRATMPSAVSVKPDGTLSVGLTAKNRARIEPDQSILSAKRAMGDTKTRWTISGRQFTPVMVSAEILKRLKQAAEEELKGKVNDAVITVPAYFTNAQKQATLDAGLAAGLNVLQLLPEPTAAAVAYGFDKGRDQTLLVYDLGGGTFDVSILLVRSNRFEVIGVDGASRLGGDDFDALIVEHFLRVLECDAGREGRKGREWIARLRGTERKAADPQAMLAQRKLKEAAEQAKFDLSESETAEVIVPEILGRALEVTLTRREFERLIAPLVDQTLDKVRQVMQDAKMSAEDIDRVILVGGSTRSPIIRQRLTAAIKEPYAADRVEEVVAHGAAIFANSLRLPAPTGRRSEMTPAPDLTPIEITNVTAHALGVRVTRGSGRSQETDHFHVLIPKNTPVPKVVEYDGFTTQQTNQRAVTVAIFQGAGIQCKENAMVGSFELSNIPPAPAGTPEIHVRFALDASDLLTVTATCSGSRQESVLDVRLVSREQENAPAASQIEADIVFLVDTSGSMSKELQGVKASCLEFAKVLTQSGIDCRLGLVDFAIKRVFSGYETEVFPLCEPEQLKKAIKILRIGRLGTSGCYIGKQDTLPVIQTVLNVFEQDKPRGRIVILISDEVGNDVKAIAEIERMLIASEVTLHALGVNNSCHERLAKATGGRFWDIHASRGRIDFSSLLDAIATEITNMALRNG